MSVVTDTITIKDDLTFLVSDFNGDLTGGPDGHGMYLRDTRYLSRLELMVNGARPYALSHTAEYNIAAKFRLSTGHEVVLPGWAEGETLERAIPHAVAITRQRYINRGLVETVELTNYHPLPLPASVALRVGADFADIFEVRGLPDTSRRHPVRVEVGEGARTVIFRSEAIPPGGGARRSLHFECNRQADRWEEVGSVSRLTGETLPEVLLYYDLDLQPHSTVTIQMRLMPTDEGEPVQPARPVDAFDSEVAEMRAVYTRWLGQCTSVETGDYQLDRIFKTSTLDLRSLMQEGPTGLVVTAGLPWYFTLFGRDSLITALQTLCLNPQIAIDTLRALAAYQADGFDDFRDMEPGKILHELRRGDLTVKGEMPHSPYYGSVDSTLLFILLYSETFKWVDDPALFQELWPNVAKALEWAENYGDLDGDGYIEFKRRSRRGILHQGWKDSDESMGGDLGPRPAQPLALVEVQGYWYAALEGLAETLRVYGSGEQFALAEQLQRKAAALKEQFNRDFWWPEEGFYAQALDANKRQVRAVTSNIGHCLWNGIIDEEKSPAVVQRLVRPDMLSGWGVRTMSMQDPSYNPMSYHNGSVWPHDNSLLIMGLRRYGFQQEMLQVVEEIFAAATTFPDGRLPELYCGFERGIGSGQEASPAPYPVSCSPQAWAAGTPPLVLQALLGLQADARGASLGVSPQLPQGVDDLSLTGLRVGNGRADLLVWRDPESGEYGVSVSPGPDEPGTLKVTIA
jgi:glycogen debranching enzyme